MGIEIRTGTFLAIDDERKLITIVEFTGEFSSKSFRTVDGHPVNRINQDTFEILDWDPKTGLRDAIRVRKT